MKQIDISCCKSKCKFREKSIFLTFNYTRTLEDIYEIRDNEICHIHGKVGDADLIIGHCWNYGKEKISSEKFPSMHSIIASEFKEKIMAKLEKKCDDIVVDNTDFFGRIRSIARVVVLGHSLSEVDMPYFREISRQVGNEVIWDISYHTDNDKKRIDDFTRELNIKDGYWNRSKFDDLLREQDSSIKP